MSSISWFHQLFDRSEIASLGVENSVAFIRFCWNSFTAYSRLYSNSDSDSDSASLLNSRLFHLLLNSASESNSISLFRNFSQSVFFQLYRLVDKGLSTKSLLFGYILNDITSWSDPVSILFSIFHSLI